MRHRVRTEFARIPGVCRVFPLRVSPPSPLLLSITLVLFGDILRAAQGPVTRDDVEGLRRLAGEGIDVSFVDDILAEMAVDARLRNGSRALASTLGRKRETDILGTSGTLDDTDQQVRVGCGYCSETGGLYSPTFSIHRFDGRSPPHPPPLFARHSSFGVGAGDRLQEPLPCGAQGAAERCDAGTQGPTVIWWWSRRNNNLKICG